jgi:hypothetical protein
VALSSLQRVKNISWYGVRKIEGYGAAKRTLSEELACGWALLRKISRQDGLAMGRSAEPVVRVTDDIAASVAVFFDQPQPVYDNA